MPLNDPASPVCEPGSFRAADAPGFQASAVSRAAFMASRDAVISARRADVDWGMRACVSSWFSGLLRSGAEPGFRSRSGVSGQGGLDDVDHVREGAQSRCGVVAGPAVAGGDRCHCVAGRGRAAAWPGAREDWGLPADWHCHPGAARVPSPVQGFGANASVPRFSATLRVDSPRHGVAVASSVAGKGTLALAPRTQGASPASTECLANDCMPEAEGWHGAFAEVCVRQDPASSGRWQRAAFGESTRTFHDSARSRALTECILLRVGTGLNDDSKGAALGWPDGGLASSALGAIACLVDHYGSTCRPSRVARTSKSGVARMCASSAKAALASMPAIANSKISRCSACTSRPLSVSSMA